ncbi:hypothetical protein PsorP6_007569 [Peronosclerospora sorghi]|uniref:Uncharacterized protein n=1 Tax=Peronosclerospora sorghi TaxID=230839 RepID=A0ACC0WCJ4_9STRA|nr:hypothetical protein PsorP6_007569 [Peronosclerospora sorghi]
MLDRRGEESSGFDPGSDWFENVQNLHGLGAYAINGNPEEGCSEGDKSSKSFRALIDKIEALDQRARSFNQKM